MNFYLQHDFKCLVYTYLLIVHHGNYQDGLGQYYLQFWSRKPEIRNGMKKSENVLPNRSSVPFTFEPGNGNQSQKLIYSSFPLHYLTFVRNGHQDLVRSRLWNLFQIFPNRRLRITSIEINYISHTENR